MYTLSDLLRLLHLIAAGDYDANYDLNVDGVLDFNDLVEVVNVVVFATPGLGG